MVEYLNYASEVAVDCDMPVVKMPLQFSLFERAVLCSVVIYKGNWTSTCSAMV